LRVAENRHDLVKKARDIWKRFDDSIEHPLVVDTLIVDAADIGCRAVAMSLCQPAPLAVGLADGAQLLFSPAFLDVAEHDRHITMLHETIHICLGLGEHRERHIAIKNWVDSENLRIATAFDTPEDWSFEFYKHRTAFMLVRLPEEITAEQRMKRDYPELWTRRVAMYVEMRQRKEHEIIAGRAGDPVWPYSVFYEVLRNAFFVSLAEGFPVAQQELRRLEEVSQAQLRPLVDRATHDALIAERAALLDVDHEKRFPDAEAAYRRVFERIMAVPKPTHWSPNLDENG
jgi:hypothetical protein